MDTTIRNVQKKCRVFPPSKYQGKDASFVKLSVVSKMGILASFSNSQNFIKSNNKIPEYAREYKREYQFIRGINKN